MRASTHAAAVEQMVAENGLKIEKGLDNDLVMLRLSGRLVADTVPALDHAIDEAGSIGVVLDLDALQGVDSAGIEALVRWYRAASAEDRTFRLLNVSGPVLRTFQLFNLTRLFDMRPDKADPSRWNQLHRKPVWDDHQFVRRLVAGLGEGVVGLDTQGEILYADAEAGRILRRDPGDLTGKDMSGLMERLHPVEKCCLPQPSDLWHCLQHNNDMCRFEFTLVGSEQPARISAVTIAVRSEGTAAGVLMALTDVTVGGRPDEGRAAQEKPNFDLLAETVRDGLIVLAPDGLIAFNNRRFREMLGTSEDALNERDPQELLAKSSRPVFRRMRMRDTDDADRREQLVWRAADGTAILTEATIAPLLDAQGEPHGAFLVITDTTQIEKARNELAENEARYRQMVEAVTSYTYTIDLTNGRTVATSYGTGCEEVTGYTAGEFEENPLLLFGIIHSDDKDVAVRYIQRIMAGEKVAPCVFRIHHRNGDVRWLRSTAVPTLDPDGEPVRYDVLVEDITRERRLEEELRQAQKMEALGRLAGGVAHDFNNLLTAILGNLALIEMECPESQRRRLTDAQKAGQRATDLVRQLLTFSRKSRPVMQPTDMRQVVAEVTDIARKTFDRRIDIATNTPDQIFPVMADASQMHQVLLNLCINARDSLMEALERNTSARLLLSIEARPMEIDIEACRTNPLASPGRYVEMSVSDTGVGMQPDVQDRIFDPFFTTKDTKGTGLGLASVFGIVRQHGGWITVKSEPDVGACFRFYLPETKSELAEPETVHSDSEDLPRGTETILLVDDEPMVRALVEASLERLGYHVLLAKDGLDGLRAFFEHRDEIQLTILDISMPTLAGTEVLRQIRSVDSDARVILTSGYATEDSLRHDSEVRENAFLPKPFRPTDLAWMVRDVLDA